MESKGILSRFLRTLSGQETNMPVASIGQRDSIFGSRLPDVEHVLAHVQPAVDAGFMDRAEIVELAREVAQEEDLAISLDQIQRMVDERLVDHASRQASWPAITDNDRLEAASRKLETSGILVRENFTCCGTCGSYEIWDEIAKAKKSGSSVRGYAFYHSQDADGAAEGGRLHLSYGSTEEGEDASVAIASQIEAALRAEGLTVNWNGTIGQRIGIDLEWRRRRPIMAASTI